MFFASSSGSHVAAASVLMKDYYDILGLKSSATPE
jgi:hypothetical protein